MLVYISGLSCSCLLTWLCTKAKIKEKSDKYCVISAFIASLPLVFISAIRYNVGRDYRAYARSFRQIAVGARTELEWLFYTVNKVIASICRDYASIFVVTAILCTFLVFIQIFRDSPSPVQSAFFFVAAGYYFVSMNAVRQMVGCAILLCSLHAVFERKLLRFLIMVIIAGGFHKSCLLFIVIYFLNIWRVKKEFLLAGTTIIYLFSSAIGGIVNTIIAETEYSDYLGSVFETGKQGMVTLFINASIVAFCYVFFDEKNNKYYLYFVIQIIALWMAILTGKVVLINRLGFMFGLPVIILIPMAIESIRNEKLRLTGKAGIIILFFLYMLYTVGLNNSNTVLPYKTVFSRIAGY